MSRVGLRFMKHGKHYLVTDCANQYLGRLVRTFAGWAFATTRENAAGAPLVSAHVSPDVRGVLQQSLSPTVEGAMRALRARYQEIAS